MTLESDQRVHPSIVTIIGSVCSSVEGNSLQWKAREGARGGGRKRERERKSHPLFSNCGVARQKRKKKGNQNNNRGNQWKDPFVQLKPEKETPTEESNTIEGKL